MLDVFEIILAATFALLLAVLCIYGGHRLWMVWRCVKPARPTGDATPARFDELPRVTVQLPMFNESNVAERVITAAANLDYPGDRLHIQVLDDSTDDCADIARQCCERLARSGVDIQYLHRQHREGYKAGALAEGLPHATGEFIAIFDADFVPPPDVLQRTVHEFADDRVGMVQMRWAHLNRSDSLLTRAEALLLDGHFAVEQYVRASTGRWFNFNGTAGIWRRAAIDDAGGWCHDTLTEDADLSYRAQLAGWRFVYRDNVQCPAELPPTVSAFMGQQNRWNKGLIETGIKLLPRIMQSNAPAGRKIEAWFHLTSPLMYIIIALLMLVAAVFTAIIGTTDVLTNSFITAAWLGSLVFGTSAASAFYVAALRRRRRLTLLNVLLIPLVMSVCAGISVSNSKAILDALCRRRSPFVRTPKFNARQIGRVDPLHNCRMWLLPCGWVEIVLAGVLVVCMVMGVQQPVVLLGWPFLALFASGLLVIGIGSIRGAMISRLQLRENPTNSPVQCSSPT